MALDYVRPIVLHNNLSVDKAACEGTKNAACTSHALKILTAEVLKIAKAKSRKERVHRS